MKTILIDAIHCFIDLDGNIFEAMYELLEKFPNKKIILTSADYQDKNKYGLNDAPYEVFTLKHDPEKTDPEYFKIMLKQFNLDPKEVIYLEHKEDVVKIARSLGITTFHYDKDKKDLISLKKFIDENL